MLAVMSVFILFIIHDWEGTVGLASRLVFAWTAINLIFNTKIDLHLYRLASYQYLNHSKISPLDLFQIQTQVAGAAVVFNQGNYIAARRG